MCVRVNQIHILGFLWNKRPLFEIEPYTHTHTQVNAIAND